MNNDTQFKKERSNKNQTSSINLLGISLALLLAAASFLSGVHISSGNLNNVNLEAGLFSVFTIEKSTADNVDLSEFWYVWNLMEEKFVTSASTDMVTTEDRIHGVIRGLVESYKDPYTVFFPPTDAIEFDLNISGNFGGVGMEVGIRDSLVTVIAPLPNTPAAHAGIAAADIIVKIDDIYTQGITIDEAVKLIRGEKGTVVVLTIFREGEVEFLEISITRDIISIPTVETELRDGVFIISLYSFNELAEDKMRRALIEYKKSGTRKLILDLRGNPGGLLQSSVDIGSYFIDSGKVIVREHFGDKSQDRLFRSQRKTLGRYAPQEMVVLIDGGSASASEILAGALSYHGIATLIGESTFGKGSVQELVHLPDGSSVKITTARWLKPDGTSISDEGIIPDITITRTPQQIIAGEDPQMDAALKWIHGDRTIKSEKSDELLTR